MTQFTRVGGYATVLTATPSDNETSALDAGDSIQGVEIAMSGATLGDGLRATAGIIKSIMVQDDDDQGINMDVFFWDTEPSNTTFTADGLFTPNDADMDNLIGVVLVDTWANNAGSQVGYVTRELYLPFVLAAATTTIYAHMVTRGTPTYTASGLTLRVGIIQL